MVKQLFVQLRTKFMEYAKKNGHLAKKDYGDPDVKFSHNDVINFFREYLKDFRPL